MRVPTSNRPRRCVACNEACTAAAAAEPRTRLRDARMVKARLVPGVPVGLPVEGLQDDLVAQAAGRP